MSLIERLKQLESKGNHRDPSRKFACQQVSPTEMDEVFEALPKLLAVVEAAKMMLATGDYKHYKTLDCRESGQMTHWDQWHQDLVYALTALEEDV